MKQREQGFNSHPMKATLTSSSTHFVNDETPATLRADLDWRRVAAHDLQMPTAPPIHRPAGWKSPAAQDRERGSAAARGYDARWRRMRLAFLVAHPLCAECARQGQVTAATVVDHIVPHRGDQTRMWDTANLQSLCAPCHDSKTGRYDSAGYRVKVTG